MGTYIPSKDESLANKPAIQKLFLRAEQIIEVTDKWHEKFQKMIYPLGLETREVQKDEKCNEYAITSIIIIAHEITNKISKEKVKKFSEERQIYIKVIFSLFCVMALKMLVGDEKINVDGDELTKKHLKLFLILDDDGKIFDTVKQGHIAFQDLAHSKNINIINWYNLLSKSIYGYIISFKRPNEEKIALSVIDDLFNAFIKIF